MRPRVCGATTSAVARSAATRLHIASPMAWVDPPLSERSTSTTYGARSVSSSGPARAAIQFAALTSYMRYVCSGGAAGGRRLSAKVTGNAGNAAAHARALSRTSALAALRSSVSSAGAKRPERQLLEATRSSMACSRWKRSPGGYGVGAARSTRLPRWAAKGGRRHPPAAPARCHRRRSCAPTRRHAHPAGTGSPPPRPAP